MARFKFRIVEGSSTSSNGRTHFLGMGSSGVIEAKDRVDAFITLYKQLLQRGDVTIIEYVDGQPTPLGFTKEELKEIHNASIHIQLGVPKAGFQIEQIIAEE